jgi:hypothetical protein
MMTMTIRRLALTFAMLDLIAIIASIWLGFGWLVNTQAGFFGSLIVTVFSLISYKKMVENRVENYEETGRDELDRVDDPYELYDDEAAESRPKPSALKQNAKAAKTGALGFFSPLRLGGYALFLVIFVALAKSGNFHILPFLAGVSITPLGAIIYAMMRGKE